MTEWFSRFLDWCPSAALEGFSGFQGHCLICLCLPWLCSFLWTCGQQTYRNAHGTTVSMNDLQDPEPNLTHILVRVAFCALV